MKWLMMLALQTRNKITVTLETDQIAQTTFCLPTGAYFLKVTIGFQTSGYLTSGLSRKVKINHAFREFFFG